MKKNLIVLLTFVFSAQLFAQPCNMQGVYKIGPGGAYTTIASALTAIRTNGLGGPAILEIKANYQFISEAGLVFSAIPCISSSNTITLRPETGATNIVISSSFNIILLNNSKNIIIDGRPGGTGTVSQLSISCNGATTNAIQFGTNSSDNIIQYVNISGNNTGTTNGSVAFITGGCTNNIIRNCRFSGNNTGHPLICLYAVSTGAKNTNNIIQDCEFTGFFPESNVTAHGIYLDKNNDGWLISGNSFYQNIATPQWGPGDLNAITVNDTLSSNYIRDNFIGGTAPQCGGVPFTMIGRFKGIAIAAGKNGYSDIQGNTIRNINWKMVNASGGTEGFAGIHIASGKVACGTVTANTIGSLTQNGTIQITSRDADLVLASGILVGSNPYNIAITDTVFVTNNKIGGITSTVAPSNFQGAELRGIHVSEQRDGLIYITDNIIGSPTISNSLYSALATNGKVIGIDFRVSSNGPNWYNSYPIANRITGNQVSHFFGTATGILLNGGKPQVIGNSIYDMSMGVSDGSILSIYGINANGCIGGSLIQSNHFYNLFLYPQQASGITGITLDLCTGVEVSRNLMHNFQVLASTGTPIITGIDVSSFTDKISVINNMMSLGPDSSGFGYPSIIEMTGIKMTLDTSIISHNSIYLNGSGDRDANALYLTKKNSSVCRVTNNILMNVHSQSTPNAFTFNCGVKFDPLFTTTLNGLVMGGNLYQVAGTGSFTGSYNNTRYATLSAWQTAIGNDNGSITGNPNFIAASADSSHTNLHIQLPSPADAAGIPEPAVLNDYDNEVRNNLTPVDIGADAVALVPAPSIISFTPTSGGTGTTVAITGTNLLNASAVSFGGTPAGSFTLVNGVTINAVVGAGATGNVSVTTPGGTAILAGFTFVPAPTITSFTPTSAPAGATVTITGTNLTGTTAVSFGGTTAASFTVVNATTITAVVGPGSSGSVSVTTPGGTATKTGFTFIAAPTITSFTPTSAATGATVTITGTNLTGTTAVTFGGTAASSFVVVDANTVTAVVGTGTSGSVNVTTPGGTASLAGFTYNVVTSVGGPNGNNSPELTVSPNPADDQAVIKYPAANNNTYIRILDVTGRQVLQLKLAVNSKQTTVKLSRLPAGMYKICWSDGKRQLVRSLLVK